MTPDCIFCAIVTGEAESSRLYEDDSVLAFLDIQPINDGHLLVIPKQHASDLAELDPIAGAGIFRVAQSMAAALRRTDLRVEGVNLFLADGAAAGQEVFHVHLHVFPRWEGDGFSVTCGPSIRERSDLEQVATRIRAAL